MSNLNVVPHRTGRLIGIQMILTENEKIETFAICRFRSVESKYKLKDVDYKHGFLKEFIEDNGLGYEKDELLFSFIDKAHLIFFQSSVFLYDIFFITDCVQNFESKVKYDILLLFQDFPVNTSYQYAASLLNPPSSSFVNLLKPWEDEREEIQKQIKTALMKQKVSLQENCILVVQNSWVNEGSYGPQSYGGFQRIGRNLIDDGSEDYDFVPSMIVDKTFTGNDEAIWDENTFISLDGEGDSAIIIISSLSHLNYFEGIVNSTSLTSGIQKDIHYLCDEAKFVSHEDYILDMQKYPSMCLRLIPIEDMQDHFRGYEEFLSKRSNVIMKTAETITS